MVKSIPRRRKKKIMLYSFAALLSTSWILTILSATNAELKKLEIRDVDLLAGNSFADNPSALLVDDSFDEDFMTGSKSDVFLAGTGDVDSTSLFAHTSDLDYSLTDSNLASSLAESASDLFVANNIDCEAGNVDSLELVGKRRRGTICPDPSAPPVGQLDPPENEEGKKIAPQSPSALATSDEAVKAGFGENFDVCPKNFYLKSNTPVCKTYPELFREAGQSWLHLYDVEPSTWM